MESYAFGQLVQLEKEQQLQLRVSRRRMANGEGQIVVFTAAKADPKKKGTEVPEAAPKKLSLGQVWSFGVTGCWGVSRAFFAAFTASWRRQRHKADTDKLRTLH